MHYLNDDVYNAAVEELRERSKKAIYQRDFAAWLADVMHERMYQKMAEISHDVLFGPKPRTLVKSANGTGKDLALDTPILTPSGWSTMGEIQAGDYVFDEQGQPTLVTLKSEVMHNPCYRVTFDDGSSFIAGEGHLWNTLNLRARARLSVGGVVDWRNHWSASETLTTEQIAETVGDRARNHLIPLARPLQYPHRDDLPLTPYVLGAWLGDGTTVRAEMTCNYKVDGYVIDRIAAAGYPMRYDGTAERPYRFMAQCDTPRERGGKTSRFRLDLAAAGVLNNKHIPVAYLRASIEQRIDLVRGLMDTDGYADKRGRQAVFGQSNERLVRDFEELLSGLGVRYSTTTSIPKGGSRAWNVSFRSWFDPFTPGERKSAVYLSGSDKQASRLTGRTIVSVERTLTVPTACISVAAESSLYLAGRNLVPTHNTHSAARWVLWWITAFPKEEALAICTAPTLLQVRLGVFAYLKEAYGYQKTLAQSQGRAMPWPGWISEQDAWNYSTPGGNRVLAVARVPGAHDAVSSFQGLRKTGGRNLIALDEAGGVPAPIYTAIDKLMTSGDSRMAGIGNPDNRGTPFHERYTEERLMREFQLHTISAYDTPNLTGEVVYPDDPEREHLLRKGLVSASWVYDMERMLKTGGEIVYDETVGYERNLTGKPDGRFKSMILGEFPDESDRTYFPEGTMQAAREREFTDEQVESAPIFIGFDPATTGKDESVVMVNQGGRVRLFEKKIPYKDGDVVRETTGLWNDEDELTAARRVDAIARYTGATELRIDGSGLGAGIATNLERLDEFHPRPYAVIRVKGGTKSSDANRWANTRSQNHAQLREQLADGLLDIDYNDNVLKSQIRAVTYETNKRGAIQITPKEKMRTEMHGSPDRLDALIYAIINTSALTDGPLGDMKPGDIALVDPWEMIDFDPESDTYPL